MTTELLYCCCISKQAKVTATLTQQLERCKVSNVLNNILGLQSDCSTAHAKIRVGIEVLTEQFLAGNIQQNWHIPHTKTWNTAGRGTYQVYNIKMSYIVEKNAGSRLYEELAIRWIISWIGVCCFSPSCCTYVFFFLSHRSQTLVDDNSMACKTTPPITIVTAAALAGWSVSVIRGVSRGRVIFIHIGQFWVFKPFPASLVSTHHQEEEHFITRSRSNV